MKLVIGSDHGGIHLKEVLKQHLAERGIEVSDAGTYTEESCDYPDIAVKVCREITDGNAERGILVCGTGIGMSMAANKEKGIRAAVCHDNFSAKATREHNDANVLCMGARVVGPGLALMIVDTFLDTEFSGDERHIRRLSMFSDL